MELLEIQKEYVQDAIKRIETSYASEGLKTLKDFMDAFGKDVRLLADAFQKDNAHLLRMAEEGKKQQLDMLTILQEYKEIKEAESRDA